MTVSSQMGKLTYFNTLNCQGHDTKFYYAKRNKWFYCKQKIYIKLLHNITTKTILRGCSVFMVSFARHLKHPTLNQIIMRMSVNYWFSRIKTRRITAIVFSYSDIDDQCISNSTENVTDTILRGCSVFKIPCDKYLVQGFGVRYVKHPIKVTIV